MKTTLALLGILLAVSAPLSASTVKNRDHIENFPTYGDAMSRIAAEVHVTAGAKTVIAPGNDASMGLPLNYVACQVSDFGHAVVGDRVNFHPKSAPLDVRCARVVWVEKDGTLAVQGDRWPWTTQYVTPTNYVGTITLIATWK
jgi:hypothetical protein